MISAKSLRDKFEKDLHDLQTTCPHKETEELPYHFAPGHFAGMVHVCKVCEKIIEKDKNAHQSFNDERS